MRDDPEKAALESLMADASTARLGPSRVKSGTGAAELLRALGQQLMDEADSLEGDEASDMDLDEDDDLGDEGYEDDDAMME